MQKEFINTENDPPKIKTENIVEEKKKHSHSQFCSLELKRSTQYSVDAACVKKSGGKNFGVINSSNENKKKDLQSRGKRKKAF